MPKNHYSPVDWPALSQVARLAPLLGPKSWNARSEENRDMV
jgi:hypothetical protein